MRRARERRGMKRRLMASAVAFALIGVGAVALAAEAPLEVPFPAAKSDVVVYASTVTGATSSLGSGVVTNYFPRGASVVFHMYAGDVKTGKFLSDKDVKYAYIMIPGQPSLKLAYGPVGTTMLWSAAWTIPSDYALGIVPFRVLVRTTDKRYGSFQQVPVASSQLTVTKA